MTIDLNSGTDWWQSSIYKKYQKAIKGLTGLIFTVLGFTILNYGTKLETAVSASIGNKFGSISKELNGLEVRILTITILLSLIFLGRALVDTLYAWNLLKSNL